MGPANPIDGGKPVCPVCLKVIEPGPSVLRSDNLLVHFDCFDGVMRWQPHTERSKSVACTYCARPLLNGESYLREGGVGAHLACWVARGAPTFPPDLAAKD
jgi:hypothetical protein